MKTIPRAVMVLLVPLVSFPAGAQDRETRDHEGFSAIEVANGIELRVRQAADFLVEVEASNGDSADIVTEVNGTTLQIRRRMTDSRLFSWFDDYAVYVTLPELESVTASGGSEVTADGTISGDRLRVRASGGSDVAIEVAVNDLEIEISGGADVRLEGTAGSLRADTSGGSDLTARRLTAREADLRSSGGSDIAVTVLDRLVARASGGSDITYRGDPDVVDIDADRSADVTRR